MTDIAPWRFFAVRVTRTKRLSPSFLRVTFTGPELDLFADNRYDQRIKLVVPLPDSGLRHLPIGPDWYARWRAQPEEQRNPVRTYTVRAVRPHLSEVDLDLVLHGDAGPASRWAGSVVPGDEAALMGPDARFTGDHGGVEYRPPPDAGAVLIAGDETAVPAIASIVERLPDGQRGEALLEVPHAQDVLDLAVPPGFTVTWLARGHDRPGGGLAPAVRAAADRLFGAPAGGPVAVSEMAVSEMAVPEVDVSEVDVDTETLWEVPDGPAPADRPYVWLAGEAAMVRELRRHLVGERGLDRRCVAFMGYWRLGRSEDGN